MPKNPVGRKKRVDEDGKGVNLRGEAKTGGPVGREEGKLPGGSGKKTERPGGQGSIYQEIYWKYCFSHLCFEMIV